MKQYFAVAINERLASSEKFLIPFTGINIFIQKD
jgi:hypothetical protein